MARKKPVSGKFRKQQLQHARAQKAANHTPVPFPADIVSNHNPHSTTSSSSTANTGPVTSKLHAKSKFRTVEQRQRDEVHGSRMALESRFIRLPKEVQDFNRTKAATEILERPIDEELGVLKLEDLRPSREGEGEELICPKRPKWSYNSTKKEVEKNEEGMFRKWISTTDETLSKISSNRSDDDAEDRALSTASAINVSPTFYERNLNVWRQLWRTTEISEILLVLIDVRFPLLHYPPSLRSYLHNLKPRRPLILCLTKCDLVPRWLSEAWKRWFEETEGEGVSIVLMESYREEEKGVDTQGTQPRFIPSAPPPARHALLTALKSAHESLLTPPPIVSSDPTRLERWNPKCRRDVDWDSVEIEGSKTGAHAGEEGWDGKNRRRRKGEKEFVVRSDDKKNDEEADGTLGEEEDRGEDQPREREMGGKEGDDAYPYLTVGLIGQPNVGKSSLLNALLGRKVVRASKTPGKTKTLQTIYWNTHLRLCDCPGLVCPSSAGLERQVLAGILPIQNVEPVLRFVGQRVPLEKVLKLKHYEEEEEEKKRDEFSLDVGVEEEEKGRWTTDELLAEYALQQGFVTAKVGRPDIYRSGAFILRQLHSSAIPWGFRPPFPGDPTNQGRKSQEGIYLKDFKPKAGAGWVDDGHRDRSDDEDETDRERNGSEGSGSEEDEEETEEEDSADEKAVRAIQSVFSALEVEGDDDSASEEEGTDEAEDEFDDDDDDDE